MEALTKIKQMRKKYHLIQKDMADKLSVMRKGSENHGR